MSAIRFDDLSTKLLYVNFFKKKIDVPVSRFVELRTKCLEKEDKVCPVAS